MLQAKASTAILYLETDLIHSRSQEKLPSLLDWGEHLDRFSRVIHAVLSHGSVT